MADGTTDEGYPLFNQSDFQENGCHVVDTKDKIVITADVTERDAYHRVFKLLYQAFDHDGKIILFRIGSTSTVGKISFQSVATNHDRLWFIMFVEEEV